MKKHDVHDVCASSERRCAMDSVWTICDTAHRDGPVSRYPPIAHESYRCNLVYVVTDAVREFARRRAEQQRRARDEGKL